MHTCRRIGLCPADLARASQRIPGSRSQSILVPCTPEFPGNNFQVLLQATGHPAEVWFRRAPREGEELLTTPSRLCNRATRSQPQTRTHLTRTPPSLGRDARQRVCGALAGGLSYFVGVLLMFWCLLGPHPYVGGGIRGNRDGPGGPVCGKNPRAGVMGPQGYIKARDDWFWGHCPRGWRARAR